MTIPSYFSIYSHVQCPIPPQCSTTFIFTAITILTVFSSQHSFQMDNPTFPLGQALFPTQYRHLPTTIFTSFQMSDPSKHGYNVPDCMEVDLYNFFQQLPAIFDPNKGYPRRLQPIRARAFHFCFA